MEPTNSVFSVLLIYMSGGIKLQGTRKKIRRKITITIILTNCGKNVMYAN